MVQPGVLPTTMLSINLRPTSPAVGRRQIHYAWVIVAVGAWGARGEGNKGR